MSEASRRALVVGVGSFPGSSTLQGEPTLNGAWPPLTFAPGRVTALASVLAEMGYELSGGGAVIDPDRDRLFHEIQAAWEGTTAGNPLVLHVLSHGKVAENSGKLHVVPACGRIGVHTDVEAWLADVEERGTEGPATLFLLDVCRAGRAGRLPWQRPGDETTRAWVIAATSSSDDAYFGWFTEAVTTVLGRLTRGELGVDVTEPFLRFDALTRLIQVSLDELTDAAHGVRQFVTSTLLDSARPLPLLPFVPNPHYRPDPLTATVTEMDQGLRPFLDGFDEVFDVEHFFVRAGGAETSHAGRPCHFAGRRTQLRDLALWLDRKAVADDVIRVVTGSPGVGKSAVLGALVCAAHAGLVEAVPEVRARLDPLSRPSVHDQLAAVHVRQRHLGEIVASLARQLGFSLPHGHNTWSAAGLIEAMTELTTCPVVVVDALDEATDPVEVMTVLLLPLATTQHSDSRTPVCRLLVGVRAWEDFAPLQLLAQSRGRLVDLDDVPSDVLRLDLTSYLVDLLENEPSYRGGEQRRVREALATGIAERLTSPGLASHGTSTADGGEGPRWGEFLVARLFARHVAAQGVAVTDIDAALALARTVPGSLPAVLELELAHQSHATSVRPVLTTLAHAKGEGMPAAVIALLTPAFTTDKLETGVDVLGAEQVTHALKTVRFYLRHSVDADGITLYRLFHQGLADYLRRHPTMPESGLENELECGPR